MGESIFRMPILMQSIKPFDYHKPIIALIPARGGSKGLLGKNTRNLSGKPLLAHSIEAAIRSRHSLDIFVSTEDDKIASIAKKYGASVINRPKQLANDFTEMHEVISHALSSIKKTYGILLLLQPTSPQRTTQDIDICLEKIISKEGKSVFSICKTEHHPFKSFIGDKNALRLLRNQGDLFAPRQKLPISWRPNGAIFCLKVEDFIQNKSLYVEPALGYEMPLSKSIDIDTLEDFQKLETAFIGH